MPENQINLDSLMSPSQYAEKLGKFLADHDLSFGYSEGMTGWENQAQVLNTFTAMLEAGDVQWFANVLDLLEKEDPSLSDQIGDLRQSLQKYGLAVAERGEAGERNSISGINTSDIEHARQPIAEIILHSSGGGLETCTYTGPEAFKKDLREEIDIRGITSVSAKVLNDDQSLKYFVAKTRYEEYGEQFPLMNQWQYEKGLSKAEKTQFREKLTFIYRQENSPEFKDARLVSEPDMDNFVISKAFEHLSPGEVGQMVNQRFDQYQLVEQQRAENIIQFSEKYASRHPHKLSQQPPRSIKDKLAVAKVASAQLNAERNAGRTVKRMMQDKENVK